MNHQPIKVSAYPTAAFLTRPSTTSNLNRPKVSSYAISAVPFPLQLTKVACPEVQGQQIELAPITQQPARCSFW